jgi:signal transduction histidine kinase
MASPLHCKIQRKFFLGLAGIFLVLGGVLLVSLDLHLREMLHIEAESKAELVFSHQASLQEYVRDTLRPAVREALPDEEFLLEAMSTSFVTRRVLSELNSNRDQYLYRRVALLPRNPESQANALERALINDFKENPQRATYRGYRDIDGVEHFVLARPVLFDEGCLYCHGDPKDAPAVLLKRYGAVRGFGRRAGELAGLDLVAMPVGKTVKHIEGSITVFGGSFFAAALGVFLLIMVFFNRLVVTNLRRLTAIFRENFNTPRDQHIVARLDGGDEIESLLKAFGEFASHLRQARCQLEDYAANLEDMVQSRTAALSLEAIEHQTDVRLFVELLGDLNNSQAYDELLESALPRLAERFKACRAAYLCASFGRSRNEWPKGSGGLSQLPENWLELARSGKVRMEADRVFVPVASSELSRGLLALFWDGPRPQDLPEEVLLALGQQMAIALENLEAINALLNQNQLLELIFEGIADPLLLVDGSGAVVLANSSARALNKNLRPGVGIKDWFASFQASAGQIDALTSALAGAASSSLELELPGPRYLAVSVYPTRGSAGLGRAVVFVRDTTAEKRLSAQMQQGEKLAALGQLAAGLAHEINNPLGVISCYAQLLQKSQQSEQAKADLEVIVRHTKKAKEVLQSLLGLARVDKTPTGPSDLGAVVRDLVQIFRMQLSGKGVTLEHELAPDLPLVEASVSALEHVLTNLLANASDAVPPETGRIRVSVEAGPERRSVVLRVEDNGPGIAPELACKIFDPFFTTKELNKGTGLGLTVVHEIMRDLSGSVEVQGGQGATFVLTFPASAT